MIEEIIIEESNGYCSRSYGFKCEYYKERCEEVCKHCPFWMEE